MLNSAKLAEGNDGAYHLAHAPMALVYSVCLNPKSHDFFLVPLALVSPFAAEAAASSMGMSKDTAESLQTQHSVHFNQNYGSVNKGLFAILYSKKIITRSDDATCW